MSPFEAIVLKSYETGNSSEVVHVLSAEHGRLSLYAKGLRSPKSRFAAVLQPLTRIEVIAAVKEESDLAVLREASTIEEFHRYAHDLERFALALLLAEAGSAFAEPNLPARELYAATLTAIRRLDPESGTSAPNAACHGMMDVLHAAGTEPQLDDEVLRPWPEDQPKPRCFWLEIETGLIHLNGNQPRNEPQWPVHPPKTAPQFPLPPEAVRFIYRVQSGEEPKRLDNDRATQLLEALLRFHEYHHGAPLRAHEFWRSITGG